MSNKLNKKIIINRLYRDNANPEEKNKLSKDTKIFKENVKTESDAHLREKQKTSLPTSTGDSGSKISANLYTLEEEFFNNFNTKVLVKYDPIKKEAVSQLPLKRNLYIELKELELKNSEKMKTLCLPSNKKQEIDEQ